MELEVSIAGTTYGVDLARPRSLAIPLRFDGPQPSFFGAPAAHAQPLSTADFVGDTRQGGSCNVDKIHMVPHCNGTHTESVAHILHDGPSVTDVLPQSLMPAVVVSVTPVDDAGNRVITRQALQAVMPRFDEEKGAAVIIRTFPNDAAKKSAVYGEGAEPPFFSVDAMTWLAARGVRHLLVDFPSIDRMHDATLTNHRLFWNVADGTHEAAAGVQTGRTVTEMIFVENDISDGLYMLNLQLPAFSSDAAPSRPVVYPLVAIA